MMSQFLFRDPLWLLALLAIPLLFRLRRRRGAPALVIPFAAAWHRPEGIPFSRWPVFLAVLGLALLIGALARPQKIDDRREVRQHGYDIMLSIDLSGSMLAEDYEVAGERINRLQAIKPVIEAFINERPNDRIGIILFAGRAYTLAPLTFDHAWLRKQLERIRIGMIEDGTAIGDGLGLALARLERRNGEHNRRLGAFVVLLTDGANNRGALTPLQASDIAKARNVPVYAIGAGKHGLVPMPVFDEQGRKLGYRRVLSDLDEETLKAIAAATGGIYFHASDTNTISGAFTAIDEAQKIEFQAQSYLLVRELFPWLALPGFAVLFAAGILARPPWRREVLA